MTLPRPSRRKAIGIAALAALALIVLAYGFVEPYWIRIDTRVVRDPDIPPAFDGTRIVFLSDIHHGPYFGRARVARLVERVNALDPDLVLLGGDYVHRDPKYIGPVFAELAGLRAPLGVYGVIGNHDHWEGYGRTRDAMEDAGIVLLDDRAVWIEKDGARIRVGGVSDLWEGRPDIEPTLRGAGVGDFVLLLSHNPDFAERVTTNRIDLMLAGHTHGGQVTLLGLWAPLIPSECGQKYRSGWVETEPMPVLVSTGIGTITPPVRLFARPQINVLVLRAARGGSTASR